MDEGEKKEGEHEVGVNKLSEGIVEVRGES